jgi:hypothetical protein
MSHQRFPEHERSHFRVRLIVQGAYSGWSVAFSLLPFVLSVTGWSLDRKRFDNIPIAFTLLPVFCIRKAPAYVQADAFSQLLLIPLFSY